MSYAISSVCRVSTLEGIATIMKEGEKQLQDLLDVQTIEIPESLLAPRQVTIDYRPNASGLCGVTLVPHRDVWIPVIARAVAAHLVRDGVAKFEKQSLLIYARDHYLADNQVPEDEKETIRTANPDWIVVAVIGGHRGIHAACRNVVDGQIVLNDVKKHLTDAWTGRNTFLIED